jgi:hypothetical protein
VDHILAKTYSTKSFLAHPNTLCLSSWEEQYIFQDGLDSSQRQCCVDEYFNVIKQEMLREDDYYFFYQRFFY